MRYRIDDLGWYHFELLAQSVLKAECGLLLQSWGGHSDLGRDAYSTEELVIRGRLLSGPTVFQAKFVQGANAAGAKWKPLLLKAVTEEAFRIKERIEDDDSWTATHYFLFTNAPLDADARGKIERIYGLRMSGRWLEEHGFPIGAGVQIVVEPGRVTLISEAVEPAVRSPPRRDADRECARSESAKNHISMIANGKKQSRIVEKRSI